MTQLPLLLSFFILFAQSPPVTYKISATLNPGKRTISGKEIIIFRNRHPSALNSILLYLYPNAFSNHNGDLIRALAKQGRLVPGALNPKNLGALIIEELDCAEIIPQYRADKTIVELLLPRPLAPGDSVTIKLSFTTRIPTLFTDLGTKGKVFVLSRWYPQVVALDESGWHQEGFHLPGSAPGALADYEIEFTLPDKFALATPGTEIKMDEAHKPPFITHHFCARWLTDFPIIATSAHVKVTDTAILPHLHLLLRPERYSRAAEKFIRHTARMSAFLFSHWFGELAESSLTVIDLTDIAPEEIAVPGLVIINQKPLPFLRLQERALVTAIAHQWFCRNPAPNPIRDPMLFYGLPVYAATRYLEAIYGKENLLNINIPFPFLAGVSDLYLHQIYHYIAATNNLTQSLTRPLTVQSAPVASGAVYRSQSALILKILEQELGTTGIDSAIRHYLATGRGRHTTTAGFLACITRSAGPEKEVIINRLVSQTGTIDLKITGLQHHADSITLIISATSPPNLPIEVKTIFSDNSYRIDTLDLTPRATRNSGIFFHFIPVNRKVRQVILDPNKKILEPNRWNNYFPAQVAIKPIFRLPSFDTYQIFYGPWFWYDNYRGFQPGIWFQGRRFIDAGIIRGDHNWTLICNYASHKSDWHTGISYQTPLTFNPFKSRVYLAADNSFRDRGIRAYVLNDFGPALNPNTEIDFGYRLYELIDTTGRDPRAWTPARIAALTTRLVSTRLTPFFTLKQELSFHQGIKTLLSQFRYSKISLEENCTIFLPGLFPLSVRIFTGAIFGTTPPQEDFYLSGGLSYTNAEPISWAYAGMASGQEHWHYDGDVNCRGYYGLYRRGHYAYGINIHLIPVKFLQPFLDIGNVGERLDRSELFPPVLDAGIRLKLGPFYADFPFWKSHPEENESHFAFRWSLGFKLSDILGGI